MNLVCGSFTWKISFKGGGATSILKGKVFTGDQDFRNLENDAIMI